MIFAVVFGFVFVTWALNRRAAGDFELFAFGALALGIFAQGLFG